MLDDVSDGTEVPGSARDDAANLVSELFRAIPRLVDRTKSQAELATSLVGFLPCFAGIRGTGGDRDRDSVAPGMHETVGIDVLSLLDDDAAAPRGQAAAEGARHDGGAPSGAATPEPPAPPAESDLPIQDYDSLAASQVVPRLATMSEEELRAVRSYELAHRNRQTILNRVNQRLTG